MPDRPDDTPDLLRSAIQGDARAVEALLVRYLPGLRAFVRLRGAHLPRRKEGDSDIVQSVCREVLEHVDEFGYGGEVGFRRWLYRKALRKIGHRHAHYRAGVRDVGREVSAPEEPVPEPATDTPSQQAMAREDWDRLHATLEGLPPDYREVIVLSRLVGMSHAEIAAELDRSEGAVRTLLSRALARLAESL